MAIKNFAIVSNDLVGVFNKFPEPFNFAIQGCYSFEDLCKEINPVLKNKFIDILILDSSAFLVQSDLVEFVKYIRRTSSDLRSSILRIILVAPNLSDESILHYLVTYNVYDIINPELSNLNDVKIDDFIFNELMINISNPKTFSQVEQFIKPLTVLADSNKKVKQAPLGQLKNLLPSKSKPRAYFVFTKNAKESFARRMIAYKKKSKLDIVDYKEFSDDPKDALTNIGQLFIEILVLYRPTLEHLSVVYDVIHTIDSKINIYVFNTDVDMFDRTSKLISSRKINDSVKSLYIPTLNFIDMENVILDVKTTQYKLKQTDILRNKATVISVLGSKGGVGTTTVASLLGKAFSSVKSLKVCVVDFSYFVGDLNANFGIPSPTLNIFSWYMHVIDLYRTKVSNIESNYDNILKYCERDHDLDNLYILNTPNVNFFKYSQYSVTEDERELSLNFTMDALKAIFDVVILDINTKYSNYDMALENSTHVVVVTEPRISAVYRFKELLNDVFDDDFNFSSDKILVVLNKDNSKKNILKENIFNNFMMVLDEFGINKRNLFRVGIDSSIEYSADRMDILSKNKRTNKVVVNLANSILSVLSHSKYRNYLSKDNRTIKTSVPLSTILVVFLMLLASCAIIASVYWYLFIGI